MWTSHFLSLQKSPSSSSSFSHQLFGIYRIIPLDMKRKLRVALSTITLAICPSWTHNHVKDLQQENYENNPDQDLDSGCGFGGIFATRHGGPDSRRSELDGKESVSDSLKRKELNVSS